ncbi:hypothetical protein [Streptomyces carpaticus]|uniref:GATA-type domain-containing protein n=1 Tax=Streptomyces carpaticus TaxID=285558 RepID=A0ABV4ZMB5_9ACTN
MTAPTPLAWLHAGEFTGWAQAGRCSMCRADDVPVLWAGSVVADGRARAVRACGSCLATLRAFVRGEQDGPCAPTRHTTGELRRAAPVAARRAPMDRAFTTITVLGLAALAASVVSAWWTVR